MILAAGEGTRFGELTKKTPKALLPCLGQTLIEHLVDTLLEGGVDTISIGVGWKGDGVKALIESKYSHERVSCITVPSYRTGPLQTLVTTAAGLTAPTLICPVDFVVNSHSVKVMLESYEEVDSFDLVMAIDSSSRRGAPLMVDADLSVKALGKGSMTSAMILLASTQFLDYCRTALSSGATKIVQVIDQLIAEGGAVVAKDIDGFWADIDSMEDLLDVNAHLLQDFIPSPESLFIPSDDLVEVGELLSLQSGISVGAGVKFKGPVLLSNGTKVGENCTIGPNVCIQGQSVISEGCTISNCIIFGTSTINPGTSLSRMIVNDSDFYMV